MGDIVLARDEIYFDGLAFLIGVEPCTYVLVAGQVEEGCGRETWGLSLAFDQARDETADASLVCPTVPWPPAQLACGS